MKTFACSWVAVSFLATVLVADANDADDIRARVRALDPHHPRLMASEASFQALTSPAGESRLKQLRASVVAEAEALLGREPVRYQKIGRRLLAVSREALHRIATLSAAFRLTGDERFLVRVGREMEAVCAFEDWNPSHFLDTGEMTLAVAIGYDWLFDRLPPEVRRAARDAILHKGIEASFNGDQSWINGTNNWSQVCHAGMVAGALAVAEDEPDLAVRVVERAVAGVPASMRASFSPDGAYPEGPGYWSYGTTFNVILLDCLRSALGSDFGLAGIEGFSATGDYIAHVAGPTGQRFNYADSSVGVAGFEPALYWLARSFRRSDWTQAADRAFEESKERGVGDRRRFSAFALLWAQSQPEAGMSAPAPLDFVAGGLKPIAVFRSAWNDPQAIYLGVCAGTPASNHGHMDVGSFVFEALGVRWAIDLGAQEYESLESKGVDLWNRKQESQRWTVFRLNNHAHNTLVIGGALQRVAGTGVFLKTETGVSSPGCTVDLLSVYAGQASQLMRTFSLPNRERLSVVDHLEGIAHAATIRWQMTTRAAISVTAPQRALLTQEGRRLEARIVRPAGATWQAVDLAAPRSEYDAPNPGVRQLAAEVAVEAGSTLDLEIELTPVR